MPAAAVIPALIAYTKVAAVKKLVVENRRGYIAVPGLHGSGTGVSQPTHSKTRLPLH